MELPQKVEPDQPVDVPAPGQILHVNAKVTSLVPEATEALDPDQVAWLVADRRAHHRPVAERRREYGIEPRM